jgi:hypothetical protein
VEHGGLRKNFGEEDGVWRFFGRFPTVMVAGILENTLTIREIRNLEGFVSSSLARQESCLWPILPQSVQ